MKISSNLLPAPDSGFLSILIVFNLSAPFEMMSHTILFDNFFWNFRYINWLTFLTIQSLFNKKNTSYSLSPGSGVHKGSVLEHLLYITFLLSSGLLFVHICLDYCNFLLFGLPAKTSTGPKLCQSNHLQKPFHQLLLYSNFTGSL